MDSHSHQESKVFSELDQIRIFLLLTTLSVPVTKYVLNNLINYQENLLFYWEKALDLRKKAYKKLLLEPEGPLTLVEIQDHLNTHFDFTPWIRLIRKASQLVVDIMVLKIILDKDEQWIGEILDISYHQVLICLSEGFILLGEEIS